MYCSRKAIYFFSSSSNCSITENKENHSRKKSRCFLRSKSQETIKEAENKQITE